jgi:hypothetical protein
MKQQQIEIKTGWERIESQEFRSSSFQSKRTPRFTKSLALALDVAALLANWLVNPARSTSQICALLSLSVSSPLSCDGTSWTEPAFTPTSLCGPSARRRTTVQLSLRLTSEFLFISVVPNRGTRPPPSLLSGAYVVSKATTFGGRLARTK